MKSWARGHRVWLLLGALGCVAVWPLLGALGCEGAPRGAEQSMRPGPSTPVVERTPTSTAGSSLGAAGGGTADPVVAPTATVPFAEAPGGPLLLDLYRPATPARGLVIWVHGGAWRAGSRQGVDLLALVPKGWALASVDYRLSGQARFPAQAEDIKGAVRYLRAHANDYGYPAERIAVAGSSAGGHLAALVGLSAGVTSLEGTVGGNLDISSKIQAIVDLYGASNLQTILSQSTPYGLSVRVPALEALLGGTPDRVPDLARLASPIEHLDAADPPLLLLHGDADQQMPIAQSEELAAAYRARGLTVEFEVVPGAGHGGREFASAEVISKIDGFLARHLAEVSSP